MSTRCNNFGNLRIDDTPAGESLRLTHGLFSTTTIRKPTDAGNRNYTVRQYDVNTDPARYIGLPGPGFSGLRGVGTGSDAVLFGLLTASALGLIWLFRSSPA